MQAVHLDKEKVKQVASASKTATNAMVLLACRQRARSTTNISALREQLIEMGDLPIGKEYMDFWRGLEAAGAGAVILGRRGKQTRFEWNYSLKEIAKFAVENQDSDMKVAVFKKKVAPKSQPKLASKPKVAATPAPTGPVKQERLIFSIPIRKDFSVEVSLPSDISSEEIERIKGSLVSPAA